jgi:hypothetical protein
MSGAPDLAAFDPIFIVGAPRSGTTLLRAMLSRSADLVLWRQPRNLAAQEKWTER